jgi:putative membrane protein
VCSSDLETRTLLRHALTLVQPSRPEAVRQLALRLIAFTHALRHQLRDSDPMPDLQRLLPEAEAQRVAAARYKPVLLLVMASEWLRDRRAAGELEPVLLPSMEESVGRLNAAMGGCERIAGTPIPFTYAVLIHRTICIYCALLPFGLIDAIGPMTPLIVAFISYTFFALEAVGDEIEEPFGLQQNDLALDALSRVIEENLREMLGETLPPPEPLPASGVLT